MKIAPLVPVVIEILLLLKFGDCDPVSEPCDEDRHPKIFGLLGVLTGVHLTRKFNMHTSQYNFFGSDWSSLSVNVGHHIPSTTSVFAGYYHHDDPSESSDEDDDHDSPFSHSSLNRKYGRRLGEKETVLGSSSQDQLRAVDVENSEKNSSGGRSTRQATTPTEDTTESTDTTIESSEETTTLTTDSTLDPTSTTTVEPPTLPSVPTDSYGPPPSGIPTEWGTSSSPSYTPHQSYGPPTSYPTSDYGHSKTRDVHAISFTTSPKSYPHHNYPHSYHHYVPHSNYYLYYDPHFSHYSAFKPSIPDHYRNSWDPHGNYFVPLHFNNWHKK